MNIYIIYIYIYNIYIYIFNHGSYWCAPKNQPCLRERAINMGQIYKYRGEDIAIKLENTCNALVIAEQTTELTHAFRNGKLELFVK